MALLLLVLVAMGLFIWGTSLQGQVKKLKDRLRPIESIDLYATTARRTADSSLAKAREEAEQIINAAKAELAKAREEFAKAREEANSSLTKARGEAGRIINAAKQENGKLSEQINSLKAEAKSAQAELDIIREGLRLKADDAHLLEVGYYRPVYGFEDLPKYQEAIEKIKEAQKAMLRVPGETGDQSAAAYATKTFSLNGSDAQGRKLLKKALQLMLRAFNGECDAFIARANYRNVTTMQKRIQSSFDQVNKIADIWHCQINRRYLITRLDELNLVYEYAEFQEKVKQEQAAFREQMREDERAAREAERIRKQLKEDKENYERQLATEKDKAKIKELERMIEEISQKDRAVSQAQLTRAGHVYVLSNVGSFGEDVFKIGMTRRNVPEERVKELGDASVPFPFDIHAMIRTKDAPALEKALHNHFGQRRLNLENERKEFFSLQSKRSGMSSSELRTSWESNQRLSSAYLPMQKNIA